MNLYSCLRSELCPREHFSLFFPHSNDRKALKKLTPPPRKKRYFLIAREPRIRYFLILRDPVVSGIRYFFIPRDPVVPCVWWCPGGAFFLFGGEGGGFFFFCISLSLRLPLSLRSRDATISLRLYGAEIIWNRDSRAQTLATSRYVCKVAALSKSTRPSVKEFSSKSEFSCSTLRARRPPNLT